MANKGVNKVILIGNLGADPEIRTFQNGDMVANFSIATSESWEDKNTGEEQTRTEWHRCVAYRGLAGVIQKYVRKGSKLYVEGKLQTRKWQDQQGIDRYSTEIIIDQMQMLDSKRDNGGSGYAQPPAYAQKSGATNAYAQEKGKAAKPPQRQDFDDDNIPF